MRSQSFSTSMALGAGLLLATTSLAAADGFPTHRFGPAAGYGGSYAAYGRPVMGYARPAFGYARPGFGYARPSFTDGGGYRGYGYARPYAYRPYGPARFAYGVAAGATLAGAALAAGVVDALPAGVGYGGYAVAPAATGQVYTVPRTVYTPVTQTRVVPVTTYQTVQSTQIVPQTVYDQYQRVCNCQDVSVSNGGYGVSAGAGVIYNRPGLFTSGLGALTAGF